MSIIINFKIFNSCQNNNMFLLWVAFIWHIPHSVQKVMCERMTCRSERKRFWNQTRLYSFVFLYVCIFFMIEPESVLILIECFICWYLLVRISSTVASTFFICSEFCVENWLLCCDLNFKWVTWCKRFWKWALQVQKNSCVRTI